MNNLINYFTALCILSLLLGGCKKTLEADLIIKNINVINVENGLVSNAQDVLIKGDRIFHIEDHSAKTTYLASEIVDGKGKFLIPGLWDMHVHVFDDGTPNTYNMKLMAAYGITGVREMYILPNEQIDTVKSWNKSIQEKTNFLPRIGAVGTLVDGNPPIYKSVDTVTTKEAAVKFVKKLKSAEVDFVKTYDNLSKEAFDALIEEAKKQNMYVAGHIPKSISMEYASDAGLKSMEHFFGLSLACSHKEDSLRSIFIEDQYPTFRLETMSFDQLIQSYDSVKSKKLIEKLAQNKTFIVPTLVFLKNWMNGESIEEIEEKFNLGYIPSKEYADWQLMRDFKQYAPTDYQLGLIEFYEHQQNLLLKMHKAGVPILAGTDVGTPYIYPGLSLIDELKEMTKAGLTNLEALQTATLNPAIYLGKTDALGTIEKGKLADFIILDSNPLDDIDNLKTIWGSSINGNLFDRNELDSLLEEVLTQVKNMN